MFLFAYNIYLDIHVIYTYNLKIYLVNIDISCQIFSVM